MEFFVRKKGCEIDDIQHIKEDYDFKYIKILK